MSDLTCPICGFVFPEDAYGRTVPPHERLHAEGDEATGEECAGGGTILPEPEEA